MTIIKTEQKKQHPNAENYFFKKPTLLKYIFLKSGNHGCKPVEKDLMHSGKEQWISGLPLWPESRARNICFACQALRWRTRRGAGKQGTESYFMKQLY